MRNAGSTHAGNAPAPELFHLSKWYMDCANERGEAFIGYWAELRWRRIAAHYASAMSYVDGRLREHSSLLPGAAPQPGDGLLEWHCAALGLRGTWRGGPPGSSGRALFSRGRRGLEWRCLQPMADAVVRCGESEISGTGYTECITLTLAPWELPIEELRWGRAHFPGRSAVWIDWTGPCPLHLVLLDAAEVEGAGITDEAVSTPGTTIRLGNRRALREGPAAATSAGSVPGVRKALSKAGLLIDEHKWLSAATLEEGDRILHGVAIHEVVKWR